MKEKKQRVEGALSATRAAVEEGILAGGGIALLRCQKALKGLEAENEDQKTGINIIRKVLEEPTRIITDNAGYEGSVIINKVKESTVENMGFDARNGEYIDMLKAGITDPAKVERVALQNAASVAGLMLMTETTIAEIPEEKPSMPEGMPPGGGGMPGPGMY
jgi:chaperonin GroEL